MGACLARLARGQAQRPLVNPHILVGRDGIDMVGLNLQAFGGFRDVHRGGFGKQVPQLAFVIGIKVLNEDKGHPGAGRQVREQLCEGLQPPC